MLYTGISPFFSENHSMKVTMLYLSGVGARVIFISYRNVKLREKRYITFLLYKQRYFRYFLIRRMFLLPVQMIISPFTNIWNQELQCMIFLIKTLESVCTFTHERGRSPSTR
jgi:hypothetical protein